MPMCIARAPLRADQKRDRRLDKMLREARKCPLHGGRTQNSNFFVESGKGHDFNVYASAGAKNSENCQSLSSADHDLSRGRKQPITVGNATSKCSRTSWEVTGDMVRHIVNNQLIPRTACATGSRQRAAFRIDYSIDYP